MAYAEDCKSSNAGSIPAIISMEYEKQSIWHTNYIEYKKWYVDTKANRNYKRFAKRQFHKTRRQCDKKMIHSQVAKSGKGLNNSSNSVIFY
jgi:hypothetical protein